MRPDDGLPLKAADRSVLRSRVAAGDHSTDRRGRRRSTPAFLSYGFRPFFLLGAAYAALAVPLWLWMYETGGIAVGGPFRGSVWHAHEMIFGYVAAVMTGFVLTAVPNWTGRLPLSGAPLAFLVATWLAGRFACAMIASPFAALLIDMVFPTVLAVAVWREVIAGHNWRNMPVGSLLTLFAAANLLHHIEQTQPEIGSIATRLALGVMALMIALIGGRIVPSFTRNWLVKRGEHRLPASFGLLDRATLIVVAVALAAWIATPSETIAGLLLMSAGILLLVRLLRWRGVATWREPILLILHVGYFWLAVSLFLLGVSNIRPDIVSTDAALHALTAGAIATMTLAVMTRASLGHTGRTIGANFVTIAIFVLVTIGALLRVWAPLLPDSPLDLLVAGGMAWSAAFGLFAICYGPMLLRPRIRR